MEVIAGKYCSYSSSNDGWGEGECGGETGGVVGGDVTIAIGLVGTGVGGLGIAILLTVASAMVGVQVES